MFGIPFHARLKHGIRETEKCQLMIEMPVPLMDGRRPLTSGGNKSVFLDEQCGFMHGALIANCGRVKSEQRVAAIDIVLVAIVAADEQFAFTNGKHIRIVAGCQRILVRQI